ncbi:MAG: Hsp20/alpha crystallin family protein [Candidatus Hydrogenedentes bacterium]|nr:Hsp20/alpha crystallin family protein [Candidatus Hydrogenedentota bacterium]
MALRTWDPFRELDGLRREVERAFDEFGAWRRPFSRFSFLPALGARSYPLMNLGEDKDNIYVEALAPGLNPESLDISVQQGTLRIAGEKPAISPDVKAEAYHRNERSAGSFVRSMELPTDVNAAKVKAQYKNGLLLITLPKAEAAKPKQIRVDVA